MLVLPWFIRFGLDCTVALTPIIYFSLHPTTHLFEYFQNRRRLVRRKTYQDFAYLSNQPVIGVEEAKTIFKEIGIEQ